MKFLDNYYLKPVLVLNINLRKFQIWHGLIICCAIDNFDYSIILIMRLYIITFIVKFLLAVNISPSLFQMSNYTHACPRFTFRELLKNPLVPFIDNELLKNQEPDTLKTTNPDNSANCSEIKTDSILVNDPNVKEQRISIPLKYIGRDGQIYIISSDDSIN